MHERMGVRLRPMALNHFRWTQPPYGRPRPGAVVNDQRNVIGMITDRDICIAAATRSATPADIRVRDVMSGEVHACALGDDVHVALKTMKEQRVRRLPVLDGQERLAGIISMNDLVMRAECRARAAVSGEEFLETLKSICASSREAVPA